MRLVVIGDPLGKPRMTNRDRWTVRPNVAAYRLWADLARLKAFRKNQKAVLTAPTDLRVVAYFDSGERHRVGPHTVTPDGDNVLKGVCDALFVNDQMIWQSSIKKYWCDGGQPRTEIEWE